MKKWSHIFHTLPTDLKKSISRWWYEYISRSDIDADMLFMNYGYVDLDPHSKPPELNPEDERDRYSIQLYHHPAANIDWQGLNALEVSCGRGGGASYIMRYFGPKSLVGLDITASAIDFCNRYHAVDGLSFVCGDAERLQFDDNSLDVVINVEASNNYPNVENFFREVARVLRPNGHFLYADMRKRKELDDWYRQMSAMDLELVSEENITPNVLRALDLDNERKKKLIAKYAPKILHKIFDEFAGVQGSHYLYESLKNGEKVYKSFVFRKPGAAPGTA